MSIDYKVHAVRPNLANKNGKRELFIARPVSSGSVSLDRIAQMIEEQSSLTTADVYAVVEALSANIERILLQGQSVELGKLGRLSLSMESTPAESRQDFSYRNIDRLKIRYTSNRDLEQSINRDASFHDIDAKR